MWEGFLKSVEEINGVINSYVWGWPTIILILGTGLLLTIRTRFLQVRKFGESLNTTIVPTFKSLGKKKQKDGRVQSISQFEAFSTAISGTVGTGNIIGVVAAILTGGPGAVLWMWISAFFGMVTNYAENVLGLYYRKRDSKGNLAGGAFYYIAYGLKWKWLAYVASVFCILAAIGMSGVQTNKISGSLAEAFARVTGSADNAETVKLIIGIIVAVIAATIIIGGIKRIGKVASMLVPFMSLLFIILALISIGMHYDRIGQAFGLIFSKAFSFEAAGGGILGFTFATVIKKGMARGVFSNEAGLGSSVIAHSASETREPVKQGLWGVFEIFFDTFIICTLTALMFLTTNDVTKLSPDMNDSVMSMSMFSDNFGAFGTATFSIILPLFAFTTIIAWSYYGEKGVEFFFSFMNEDKRKIPVTIFKVLYVVLIAVSATIHSQVVWDISDTCNGLMALPNLICLVALSGLVAKITKNYFDRKKGVDVEPMLSAYPDMNEEFKQDITSGDIEMQ
ncbi:alanine/glycine:cation symporter family protein [Ruminococcus difficilis]|uniref:Alanine:cation symporter family protein n=1 Tax=Ruminococcus difficilis TaxID=2763069 RepID=A0A934WTS9_9FIRM|nr:alanine/glycine:cation symporter family protein [Ruminococcus difficilis]MBK6089795.1 alanine:cation symporter family protein [Ruminococcus difficilis]